MRLTALLLALIFILPFKADSGSIHPRILDSVRPLSVVVLHDFTTNTDAYRNICTTSSINAITRLWLTAAHCVLRTDVDEDGTRTTYHETGLSIDGHIVYVVKVDELIDLAVLFTPDYARPALRLGKAPFWEDPIRVVGHPFGYSGVTIVAGTVSNPDAPFHQPGYAPSYMFVTALVAPGNSGSPVVNARGAIVSVLQIGWGRSYSPGGGVTYARLKAFAGEYFEW